MERASATSAVVLITIVAIIGLVKIGLNPIAQGILITFIPILAMMFVTTILRTDSGSKKVIHITGDKDKPVRLKDLED